VLFCFSSDFLFRYDRDFLLQFRAVCKERPDALPALDTIGLEPSDQTSPPISHGSGKRTTSTSGMPPLLSSQVSVGLGISCFKFNNFSMGNFSTPSGKMTSEERFAMPQGCTVSTSCAINTSGLPFGKPAAMIRTSGGGPDGADRTRSKRGEKRTDDGGVNNSYSQQKAPASGLELAAFLEPTADRWTRQVPTADTHSPEVVDRKVKSLLNKLTMEKFDSVSDQIIAWANKSEKEKDGRTLVQVIRLVFEKAIDEAAWSEMYARLCRKMMERISPDVQDDGIENSDGKPIAGGQLFRKYLLNRCQDDFERGWAAKDAAASSAASGASGGTGPYSEEYYTARKARRQGLGLIQFIGELYKLQMLTERIMHECIKKLLGNVDKPEEEEIESLCRLLTTVGTLLDNVKARAHMDIYFSRMRELIKSSDVSSRMHFLLLVCPTPPFFRVTKFTPTGTYRTPWSQMGSL
jgi:translation initiation factor 4G